MSKLTKKQKVAVEFFSKVRTLEECQHLIRIWDATRKYWMANTDDASTMSGAQEIICDIFMDEMCELDLHFQK